MYVKKLHSACLTVILIIVMSGCSSTPDNSAVSSDGVKINFNNQGSGEPAIVFIHGWANDKRIWDDQLSYFSKSYQSVAVDLAGFGKSGNNRKEWTIQNFANDVTAVVNKLDLKKVVLVGFSMGGPVAVEAAVKLNGKVTGVVLVDNMQNVEMNFPQPIVNVLDSMMMDLVNHPSQEKLVKGGFIKRDPEGAYKLALAIFKDNPKKGWEESLFNLTKWQNENCTETLSKLKVPVVAINSDRKPTNVEMFKKYVPTFKADIIPRVGHLIMWDDSKKFNELLQADIKSFR